MIEDLGFSEWVSIASVGIASVALLLSWRALEVNRRQLNAFKWNQALKTVDLASQWNSAEKLELRRRLGVHIELNSSRPIDLAALQSLADWRSIRIDILTHLNFLEIVAVSLQRKLINLEMSYHWFGQIMMQASTAFRPFIEDFRAHHDEPQTGIPRWGNIERAAEIYREVAKSEGTLAQDDAVRWAALRLRGETLYEGN